MLTQQSDNFLPVPSKLVSGRAIQFGVFKQPLPCVNLRSADLGPLRVLNLKEWQHFAIGNQRFFLNLAIFDSKRVNIAQIEVYDKETKQRIAFEHKFIHRKFHIPNELWNDQAHIQLKGMWITIDNKLREGYHRIRFGAKQAGKPAVEGSFMVPCRVPDQEPIVVSLPFGDGRGMYSHKGAFAAHGWLRIGNETHSFEKEHSFALPDIHKGYYPRTMRWNWGTAAGYIGEDLVGFNLTQNQVTTPKTHNENALWINGKVARLPAVEFAMDIEQSGTCQIYDDEGYVDLAFSTVVPRSVDLNVLVAQSRYRGPYGRWQGSLRPIGTKAKDAITIDLFGMAEDMYLRA